MLRSARRIWVRVRFGRPRRGAADRIDKGCKRNSHQLSEAAWVAERRRVVGRIASEDASGGLINCAFSVCQAVVSACVLQVS